MRGWLYDLYGTSSRQHVHTRIPERTQARAVWFRSSSDMRPGDTIVVPLDAERMRPLPLWTAVSTILYNIAISVAAVHSL